MYTIIYKNPGMNEEVIEKGLSREAVNVLMASIVKAHGTFSVTFNEKKK